MTDTRREELKPCPFCGGSAHLTKSYNKYDDETYYRYQCRDCRAKSGEKYARETCPVFYAGLRNDWNTRTPAPETGWRDMDSAPDWEGFGRALMEDWPTGDIDGSHLFDMSLKYGLITEVPGGYNPDEHIDAEGICPETGDPWYEYAFGTQPTTEQSGVIIARENVLNLSAWIERRKDDVGPYADQIIHSVKAYEAEIAALRSLAQGDE